jgi:hypothetical protein
MADQFDRDLRRLDVRARRRERDDLRVHVMLVEHVLPVRDVAMPANHHVVVARVMHDRVALGVVRESSGSFPRRKGVEVLRRIVVIVKVDNLH